MDWTALQVLIKAPKKKYIKKIVQYAAGLLNCTESSPKGFNTPISQQFSTDLELSSQESHRLIQSLISLLQVARTVGYQQHKLKEIIGTHLGQELSVILVDIIVKLNEDIEENSLRTVRQADSLISFDWQLDVEVANSDKGKINAPIVQLQLSTAANSRLNDTCIRLKGAEFDVFFKNLKKIKEQLSQLVSTQ